MTIGFGMNNLYANRQQMNNMYGNTRQTGSVRQNLMSKHGCADCFQQGPYFVQYPIPVLQVPVEKVDNSFWGRIKRNFWGTAM